MTRGEITKVECPKCGGVAYYRPLYDSIHMPGNEDEPAENVDLHSGYEVECQECDYLEGEMPEL